MPIDVRCPSCEMRLRVKDESAGTQVRCFNCGTRVAIPANETNSGDRPATERRLPRPVPKAIASRKESRGEDDHARPPLARPRRVTRRKTRTRGTGQGWGSVVTVISVVCVLLAAGLRFAAKSGFRLPRPWVGLAGSSEGWTKHVSDAGRYEVLFPPGDRESKAVPFSTPGGTATGDAVMVEWQDAVFGVVHADLRIVPLMADLVERGPDMIREQMGASVLSAQACEVDGREGAAFVIETRVGGRPAHFHWRYVTVGRRMYMLQWVGRPEHANDPEIDKFVASFHVQAPEGAPTMAQTEEPRKPYLERRASFQTKLTKRGPAPQEWEDESPPRDVGLVSYSSAGRNLKAWLRRPPTRGTQPQPALVYFHGGFASSSEELTVCEPFTAAGFIVMTPILRGENGQEGHFELFMGEVDDARAAVAWLARQPDVDTSRIYTFGHSVGGGISAILSLFDDLPIRHGGSSGGLYSEEVFYEWADIAPFDVNDPQERQVRVLLGNLRDMKREHYAYLGTEDSFHDWAARARTEGGANSLLRIDMVPGDHGTSLDPAVARYLEVVRGDTTPSAAGSDLAASPAPTAPLAGAEYGRPVVGLDRRQAREFTIDSALAELRIENSWDWNDALEFLAAAEPIEARRQEVSKVLLGTLAAGRTFRLDNRALGAALATWKTDEAVAAMISLLNDDDRSTRERAIVILGALKDQRGAAAVALRLSDFWDAQKASAALKSMGPAAEGTAIGLLKHTHWSMRAEACHILAAVGGEKSLTALKRLYKDPSRDVQAAAKNATIAISTRLGKK